MHVRLDKIVGYVSPDNKNTRDAIPNLTDSGYVVFPSEVTEEGGEKCLLNLAFGENKDKKVFLQLIEKHEEDIWKIANSIATDGLQYPVKVTETSDGTVLVDGLTRFLGCVIRDVQLQLGGHEVTGTIEATKTNETDREALRDLGWRLNTMRKDVGPADYAREAHKLNVFGKTAKEIARKFNWNKAGDVVKITKLIKIAKWLYAEQNRHHYWKAWNEHEISTEFLYNKAHGKPGGGKVGKPSNKSPKLVGYAKAYNLYSHEEYLQQAVETKKFKSYVDAVRYGMRLVMGCPDDEPQVPDGAQQEKKEKGEEWQ